MTAEIGRYYHVSFQCAGGYALPVHPRMPAESYTPKVCIKAPANTHVISSSHFILTPPPTLGTTF
ncbi:predicted protein [Sclerotinia sclerotiorum 1980 UF-70]|uniref:Uncharacterized protein n=2 Tax=Sclerotinia sclerotiorum (strain ATCC 18683 / 1980 / Ss-1) TaxID=665079 RepID=A7EUX0_SCLS1|nr:predicted protein [Sclerotinia sclerotiorum 1980 UF-70]APA15445.1 hypothetical protein sscle_14g102150 [Sclerotinia sclerotiorum 1980 UF-70]EDN93262.1 predicted protein [Sclerotinia sclerotiorum 1980 UF-70]